MTDRAATAERGAKRSSPRLKKCLRTSQNPSSARWRGPEDFLSLHACRWKTAERNSGRLLTNEDMRLEEMFRSLQLPREVVHQLRSTGSPAVSSNKSFSANRPLSARSFLRNRQVKLDRSPNGRRTRQPSARRDGNERAGRGECTRFNQSSARALFSLDEPRSPGADFRVSTLDVRKNLHRRCFTKNLVVQGCKNLSGCCEAAG